MFVVRRPFVDANGMITAGSIVEPADVVRFQSRLNEGHIVDVNEQNIDMWQPFFKETCGIDIVLDKPAKPAAKPAATASVAKPAAKVTATTVE